MFKRMRLKKFDENVRRSFERKFAFIESVLNSCVDLDQLDNVARWASSVINQYHEYEIGRIGDYTFFGYFKYKNMIDEYFGLKQGIVGLIFERMVKKIEKQANKIY